MDWEVQSSSSASLAGNELPKLDNKNQSLLSEYPRRPTQQSQACFYIDNRSPFKSAPEIVKQIFIKARSSGLKLNIRDVDLGILEFEPKPSQHHHCLCISSKSKPKCKKWVIQFIIVSSVLDCNGRPRMSCYVRNVFSYKIIWDIASTQKYTLQGKNIVSVV